MLVAVAVELSRVARSGTNPTTTDVAVIIDAVDPGPTAMALTLTAAVIGLLSPVVSDRVLARLAAGLIELARLVASMREPTEANPAVMALVITPGPTACPVTDSPAIGIELIWPS
jgi:hypothetical protein